MSSTACWGAWLLDLKEATFVGSLSKLRPQGLPEPTLPMMKERVGWDVGVGWGRKGKSLYLGKGVGDGDGCLEDWGEPVKDIDPPGFTSDEATSVRTPLVR